MYNNMSNRMNNAASNQSNYYNKSSPAASSAALSYGNQELMEQQNEERVAMLAQQVSQLKSLSIDIGNEVREQNSLLDEMDGSFGNVTGLLGTNIKRIGNMMKTTGGRHMLMLSGFVVFVMLFLYWIIKSKY